MYVVSNKRKTKVLSIRKNMFPSLCISVATQGNINIGFTLQTKQELLLIRLMLFLLLLECKLSMGVFIQEVSLQKHNIISFNVMAVCQSKFMDYYITHKEKNNVAKHILYCVCVSLF